MNELLFFAHIARRRVSKIDLRHAIWVKKQMEKASNDTDDIVASDIIINIANIDGSDDLGNMLNQIGAAVNGHRLIFDIITTNFAARDECMLTAIHYFGAALTKANAWLLRGEEKEMFNSFIDSQLPEMAIIKKYDVSLLDMYVLVSHMFANIRIPVQVYALGRAKNGASEIRALELPMALTTSSVVDAFIECNPAPFTVISNYISANTSTCGDDTLYVPRPKIHNEELLLAFAVCKKFRPRRCLAQVYAFAHDSRICSYFDFNAVVMNNRTVFSLMIDDDCADEFVAEIIRNHQIIVVDGQIDKYARDKDAFAKSTQLADIKRLFEAKRDSVIGDALIAAGYVDDAPRLKKQKTE